MSLGWAAGRSTNLWWPVEQCRGGTHSCCQGCRDHRWLSLRKAEVQTSMRDEHGPQHHLHHVGLHLCGKNLCHSVRRPLVEVDCTHRWRRQQQQHRQQWPEVWHRWSGCCSSRPAAGRPTRTPLSSSRACQVPSPHHHTPPLLLHSLELPTGEATKMSGPQRLARFPVKLVSRTNSLELGPRATAPPLAAWFCTQQRGRHRAGSRAVRAGTGPAAGQ